MRNTILNNITRGKGAVMGARVGTVYATRKELINIFGEPTYNEPSTDDKVTVGWIFKSPRGYFEIRDYWWNKKENGDFVEWSIAAAGKAALWARAFCRCMNLSGQC